MKRLTQLFSMVATLATFIATTHFAQAANDTWTGGSATDGTWTNGVNWGGTAPVANDTLIFTGVKRTSNTNTFTADTQFGGISFQTPAGAFILKGTNATANEVELAGDISDNQVVVPETIGMKLLLNSATPTINLNVVTNGLVLITNVVSDTSSSSIALNGGGQATLGGANTFRGTITINTNSQLNVSSDANLGAIPAALTPGEIVLNNGALRTTTAFTVSTNRGILVGPGQGAIQVDSQSVVTNSTIYNGIIANNGGVGGLTKLGFGVLTLGGSNTYTGPTLDENGSIVLNFAAVSAPTNNIINPSSTLQLGGANSGFAATNFAAVIARVHPGITNKQTFNNTLVTFGGSVVQVVTNLPANANSEVDINLGLLSHNVGGTLVVVPPSLVNLKGNVTTTAANVNGILGGWATIGDGSSVLGITIGTNYATVTGGNIGNYSGYTMLQQGQSVFSISNGVSAGMNLAVDSGVTGDFTVDVDHPAGPGTLTDINTLNWNRTDNNVSFIIGISNTLRLGRFGGILKGNTSSGNTWLVGETPGGANGLNQNVGTLTAGGADNTPGEIVVDVNNTSSSSGTIIFDCLISDNGTGPVTFVKAGVGSMKLRGHNTYSGGTYLLQGRVQFVGGEIAGNPGGQGLYGNADAGGTGPIFVLPGAYIFPSGSGPTNAVGDSLPVTNSVFIAGQGTAGEPLGAIRATGGWLFNGPWTLIGDTILGGNGGASGAIAAPLSGPFNLTFCSPVTVNGTVCLSSPSGANSWTGTTTMTARNNTGANVFLSGNNEIIPNGPGAGNVIMNGFSSGTIQWNLNGFSETVNGLITSGTAAGSSIINSGTNGSLLTVGDNEQSGVFGGSITDGGTTNIALTKIGGGIESFTGPIAITGPVNVNGGTLALSGGGIVTTLNINVTSNATLDASLVDNGLSAQSIRINNGTLIGRGLPTVINTLGLTNSHLVTVLNPTVLNITAPSFSVGGTTNIIDLSSIQGVVSYPTQFTVIQYSGDGISGPSGGFNFGLGTVPTLTTTGFVSNNVANNSVDIVLTHGPLLITWTGQAANNNWDIATTFNWSNATTSVQFNDQDSATLNNTASKFSLNLAQPLTPAIVTVNNDLAHGYTFGGNGKITGASGLIKLGTGALLLTNGTAAVNDDYTGGIVVDNGGTLIFGSTNSVTGGLNIKNGSTVIVTNFGNLPFGAVINEGILLFNATNDVVANNNINNLVNGSQDGPVIKTNTDTVTLGGSSAYQGLTIVQQGTLRAASGRAFGGTGAGLNGNTVLTVTNGTISSPGVTNTATLDLGGQTLQTATIGPSTVLVNGSGVNGLGAITNSGAANNNALLNVTLAGDTTFGGGNRWDIRTITGNGAQLATLIDSGDTNLPYTLTKVGTNQTSLVGVSVSPGVGNIVVSNGIFGVETTTTPSVGANGTNTIRVLPGATFELFNNSVGAGITKALVLNGDATGTNATLQNTSGTNLITTTINLNSGTNVFSISGTSLTLADDGSGNDTLFGAGTFLKSGGSRLFVNIPLRYTGNTIVSNGLMILGPGIAQTNATSTTFVGGGTLSGEGWFGGPVVVTGGSLSPGDTNLTAGVPDLFTLVISNSLTLGGSATLVMDMNKSGGFTGDFITNETALTIGGTLQLNLTGSPLALGDAIPIFSTNGITPTGSFSGFVPSRPGVGLAWDQSTIAGDGKIRLQVAPTTPPVINGFSLLSRTNVVISATNGSANATVKLLTSTNVARPLASWTSAGTKVFDNNGNLSFTFTNGAINSAISTNAQQQFFILQEQ